MWFHCLHSGQLARNSRALIPALLWAGLSQPGHINTSRRKVSSERCLRQHLVQDYRIQYGASKTLAVQQVEVKEKLLY